MSERLSIGDLVSFVKPNGTIGSFSGIGKLTSINEVTNSGTIRFFESPLRSEVRPIEVNLDDIGIAVIYEESVVFLIDKNSGLWRRARYLSQRPNGSHFVVFRREETDEVPVSDLYVPNLADGQQFEGLDFLTARCSDTPHFSEWRTQFVRSYIEQQSSCQSISSILSSSVEIEPHQIAVVRRVLRDEIKKYLLADEVGLGKTIEACLVLREHVLQDKANALVIVSVPEELILQWENELRDRFFLGGLLRTQVFVCPHEKLVGALERSNPTMIVIDEAHQLGPWAWSLESTIRRDYELVATACHRSDTCLLLSGTPLTGNEKNFLAMLHLLSPEAYELSNVGVDQFLARLKERERLGGMYQALIPTNDNSSLMDILEEMERLFPNDGELISQISTIKPFVDWKAKEDGEKRETLIGHLRKYIGENYRIHQRMLRNRREDSSIAGLFPGLDGVTVEAWKVASNALSVDQCLDSYREAILRSDGEGLAIAQSNFCSWVECYLISPRLVVERAKQVLGDGTKYSSEEIVRLNEIIDCAQDEQIEKDQLLIRIVGRYLSERAACKIVLFCTNSSVADHVYQELDSIFENAVERHNSREIPAFNTEKAIRILICDERGEDGLNLHGGEKLLIHYSVPISFSRIEQRNGRANRYSAAIHARPIKSIVLVPDRLSIATAWVGVLNHGIGIFNESVASLQYVLQDRIDDAWRRIVDRGGESLSDLQSELSGSSGLLRLERRKVNDQEGLNSMNAEVDAAKSFAMELLEADQKAEHRASEMFNWITKGLLFSNIKGEVDSTFRFRYNTGSVKGSRTLVDVISFLKQCITGIDLEKSDYSSPVTALMSPDRQLVSHGRQIYPMRYGQPFVDTIYQLSRSDPRGICDAKFRVISGLPRGEPRGYIKFYWLFNSVNGPHERWVQRQISEQFPPRFVEHWLDLNGKLIENSAVLNVLNAPYSRKTQRFQGGGTYRDQQIDHESWSKLEQFYPVDSWPDLIAMLKKKSWQLVSSDAFSNVKVDRSKINAHIETVTLAILIGD